MGLLFSNGNMSICYEYPLFMVFWHGKTEPSCVDIIGKEFDKNVKSKQVVLLTILEKDADLNPPQEARKKLSDWLKNIEDRTSASSIVYEGTGFKKALVCSIVMTLKFFAGQNFDHMIHFDLIDSANWIDKETSNKGYRLRKEEVLGIVEKHRRVISKTVVKIF